MAQPGNGVALAVRRKARERRWFIKHMPLRNLRDRAPDDNTPGQKGNEIPEHTRRARRAARWIAEPAVDVMPGLAGDLF